MNSQSNRLPTSIGTVQDVNGTAVSVSLKGAHLSGVTFVEGQGYRIGQVGSFVRIPIGYANLFGIVSQVGASAVPDKLADANDQSYRWLTVQLIGEGRQGGVFQRGISQYPTIEDEVHIVSERDLVAIYGQRGKQNHLVKVGHISGSQSIDALLDVNKLVTRHSAIVGTTGSGKSTTVASILRSLSTASRYPSARVLLLDIHGEYQKAFGERANVYRIREQSSQPNQEQLYIPFWAMQFDELIKLTFGSLDDPKARNVVMERIIAAKVAGLAVNNITDVSLESVNADTPVPFSLNRLWYDLYCTEFGTYYSNNPGGPIAANWAFQAAPDGSLLRGDPASGLAPKFREVKNVAQDTEKINYIPNGLNIRSQLEALGAKLRIGRFNFYLNPGPWMPDLDGRTDQSLGELMKQWLGRPRPVTILDLSGIPPSITNEVVGVLIRTIYDALFWARNLSQGARERPLLLVLEEAHTYLSGEGSGLAEAVVKRIVKEGRKYGIGAMIVSQRPSEINSTILSQCGTFIALRLSNANDRSKVTGAMSESLDGLTSMLPILRTGEAIISGEAVGIPMRTIIEPPPKAYRPDSDDPIVCDSVAPEESMIPGGWSVRMEDNPNFEELVSLWRRQSTVLPSLI